MLLPWEGKGTHVHVGVDGFAAEKGAGELRPSLTWREAAGWPEGAGTTLALPHTLLGLEVCKKAHESLYVMAEPIFLVRSASVTFLTSGPASPPPPSHKPPREPPAMPTRGFPPSPERLPLPLPGLGIPEKSRLCTENNEAIKCFRPVT